MKKWLVFLYPFTCVLIIISVCLFCLNILKEKNDLAKQKEREQKEEQEQKDLIEYKANQTIRVKLTKTGEIIAMDINDYLRGVLPAEMPPSYDIEALKAQALVARTYTYKKMEANAEGGDADVCDDYKHCQAYYNKEQLTSIWKNKGYNDDTIYENFKKINIAVVETQNEIITYQGKCIKAFFHASSPEKTENIDQIWGGEKLPYLVAVESKEDENYANRTSKVEVSFDEFLEKIKAKDRSCSVLSSNVNKVCINEYTTSGRVKNIKVGEYIISAENLRTIFSLRSTKFSLEIKENSVVFNVIGNGHGIGLSQVGANYYAISEKMNYKDIIKHYYKDIEITKLK